VWKWKVVRRYAGLCGVVGGGVEVGGGGAVSRVVLGNG